MAKVKCYFKIKNIRKIKNYELIYSTDNNQRYTRGFKTVLLQKNYDIAIKKNKEILKIKNSKSNLYYKIALAISQNDYLKSAEFSKNLILLRVLMEDEVTYPLILPFVLCSEQ